jgi:hypothetical protein
MENILAVVYIIGVAVTFFIEYNLGERILLVILKSAFWFIWIFILLFNRTGNNT